MNISSSLVTIDHLTVSGVTTLSGNNNHYAGHHFFDAYSSAGQHYPHYLNGSTGGAKVNIRVYNAGGGSYDLFYIAAGSNDMTWRGNKIWNAGNDGSGSGLDADTLDGSHASAFQAAGTYNTVIGTDTDINTSGSSIIDNIYVTDGVITSMGTRTLSLSDLGYTGATNANNYSLPAGSSSTRGGFKIGYTESGKNYPVEVSSEKMYVNVPWTDNNTTYSVGDGGLTQKNFTTTLKSKVDGIEDGATADQTAAEILTLIKTVDGAGSGLDADTVDGLTSGDFILSNDDDTAYGDLTFKGFCHFDNDHLPSVKITSDDFAEGLEIHRNHASNAAGIKFSNNGGQKGILYVDNGGVIRWRPTTSTSNLAIWHEGNDGSGSGLDADKLDGYHASSFVTSGSSPDFTSLNVGGSFAGASTPSNGALFQGIVGIGTSSVGGSYALQVNGGFAASSKSFVIDHPTKENKQLIHGSLEGPEFGVYFRGKSTSDTITMPDYWSGLVDEDTVTVELTAIGANQCLFVSSTESNGDIIVGSNTDEPLNYYYVVCGERKDVDKLVIEVDVEETVEDEAIAD